MNEGTRPQHIHDDLYDAIVGDIILFVHGTPIPEHFSTKYYIGTVLDIHDYDKTVEIKYPDGEIVFARMEWPRTADSEDYRYILRLIDKEIVSEELLFLAKLSSDYAPIVRSLGFSGDLICMDYL